MKNNLLKNMYAAIVALFVTAFALPQQLQAENYNLLINGKRVTSENCGDLTAIEGVKGKVAYDAASNVLTLENATISSTGEKAAGVALWNSIKNLTIKLVGENTIKSEKSGGMVNYDKLTFTGTGKLTITGAMSGNADYCYGVLNPGTITVDGCTMEISGGVNGITSGRWKFNKCNVRIKGNGSENDEYKGSMGRLNYIPEFTDCKIVTPEGSEWKKLEKSGYKFYSLFANNKVVTDWVTIKPNAAPEKYSLMINGKQVTSENCGDLTVIEGVKGKVAYDAASNVLTLENATISNTADKAAGVALWNSIKNLTIKIVGENSITSEKSGGMVNYDKLTFTGTGKLKVTGAQSGNEDYCYGVLNHNTITVDGATLEISGGVNGIASGRWKFNKCNVRVKGNGSENDEYKGSMGRLNVIPEFTDCKIVSPEGTVWKELKKSGYTFQSLFGADGKVVTDWVAIQPNDAPVAYDLVLEAVGDREIAVIAIVKDITGMGMMAVKKLIATAPCIIKENMTEADAKEARDKLLAVGATANIYPHGTWKKPTGINFQNADTAAQTIYNLQGIRLNTKLENLPAGVYIVNGKKVLKK
ncbi:ribosomal protein L7/L12 [Prevotella nigrescens]|uniref:ribosomal protein L7/L12 n=1 Tax=Prevotella nigrescens TaxID=28133 RepID=UPI002011C46A|nr:ribosomal protein L7/L12 [Prevotella nigrescens]